MNLDADTKMYRLVQVSTGSAKISTGAPKISAG